MNEKTYTLKLPEQLLQALGGILDAGVKHTGLASVHAASAILQLIETAEPDEQPEESDDGG